MTLLNEPKTIGINSGATSSCNMATENCLI